MGEALLILASGWLLQFFWVVGRGGVHASLSISALYLNVGVSLVMVGKALLRVMGYYEHAAHTRGEKG